MCQGKLPNGTRCCARQWLDIHHIIPVALGGTDRLENLITLCSAHHAQIHKLPARDGLTASNAAEVVVSSAV